MPRARDGDVLFLHRLQQCGLGARTGAVDLIGHQQLGEHRARNEAEIALAAGGFLKHFGAQNVGRHQVRGELDAPRIQAQHRAHGIDELGLGETRKADQQGMAAAQHRDERLFDHLVLTENDGADPFLGGAHMRRRSLGGPHNHIFHLLQAFACRCRHKAYSSIIAAPQRTRRA